MMVFSPILKDRVAVVTGASRGIGRAIAEAFAREGATVVICGRKQETLDVAAAQIAVSQIAASQVAVSGAGGVHPIACHVGRPDQIQHLVEAVHRQFGKIDILVNNAATNIAQGPALEANEAQFDKMIELNLKSAFRLIQAIAPGMCERGWGSIINIASIAGIRPLQHGMLYSMTKAALIAMTQSYALELGPRGVRVNAIAPGFVQTALSEHYWKGDGRSDQIIAEQPLKHLGQPAEIAEAALLLASDRGSYITGHTLVADGGRLLP